MTFLLNIIQTNFEILGIKEKKDLYSLLYDLGKQTVKVPVAMENAMNVMIVLEKLEASEGSEKFIEKKRNYLIDLYKGKGFNLE